MKMDINKGQSDGVDTAKIGKLIDSAISQLGQIKGMLEGSGPSDSEDFSETMAQSEEKE